MNTREINKALRTYTNFAGTYPCDRARYVRPGQGVILNTDPASESGEHWVAIFRPKSGKTEYFDSFGLPPIVDHIISYLETVSPAGWSYNRAILQHSSSDSCGHHCINYIKHRLLGLTPDMIFRHFSRQLWLNDLAVKSAVKS